MSEYTANNKRIAKNTIILYARMLLLMVVSLYTSRLVLQVLGVEDYGIYNVVGGVVAFLGFLNGTLSTASSRFITVALSLGDMVRMKKIFSNIQIVNFSIAFIIILLAESVGLWLFYNKLQIPLQRMDIAFWVYQISIFTVVLNIISVPYNATIIAHERMKAFAYISIFDAVAKLLLVFVLTYVKVFDTLLLYAIIILCIQLLDRLIYGVYCYRNFEESHFNLSADKAILTEMFKFLTWSSYGSFVSVGFTQGLNIILNMFYGPAVNAARGLSVQVQTTVVSFATNFQTAINPQIIKSVANADIDYAQQLLFACSKYSFFLLSIFALPIIVEAEFILKLWLGEVPNHTVTFIQLMLIISTWGTLANPLRVINQAEGNIKRFQLYECTLLLLIMPMSYLVSKWFLIPELVFVVHLIIEFITQLVRVAIVAPKVRLSYKTYIKSIYLKLIPVFVIPLLCALFIKSYLATTFINFVAVVAFVEIIVLLMIYFVGINSGERDMAIAFVRRKLAR
ncbi:MAG: lipopolysaccharide biosynthesis protein [Rikenellaceae bacterium]